MTFESSPSLDQYKDGIPEKLPSQRRRKRALWGVILVLLIVAFALGVKVFLQSDTAARLSGTGAITGVVIDENGHPVAAEIYVLGTSIRGQADANGVFTIEGVPAGEHAIAVAFQGSGFEYPALVQTGQTTDLGEVRFTSTLEPEEP